MDQTIFRTINSAYRLDREAGRWERLQNLGDTDPIAPLRGEDGELWAHHRILVGFPAVFYGPPVDKDLKGEGALIPLRRITTSVVIEVLSGPQDAWGLDTLQERAS